MSTPRTPPRTTESAVDGAKRNLSDSAPSNDDQKRQKAEAEAPAWAASFFDNIDSKFTSLETKIGVLSDKIDAMEGLNSRVGELEEQVTANTDELEGMQESMARLFAENKKLFAENAQLREGMAKLEITKADSGWVASIHDEQLPNSLTVCGVEKKPTEKVGMTPKWRLPLPLPSSARILMRDTGPGPSNALTVESKLTVSHL